MIRVLRAMAACLAVLVVAVHVAPWHSLMLPLHYNTSSSLPRGLYQATIVDTLRRGDILRVCVPEQVAPVALARGYVGPGMCAGGTAPVGKVLAGVPGDTVHVDAKGIRIGSRLFVEAPIRKRDTRGRLIEGAQGMRVLGQGECFVLSTYSRKSYDSRYFGPVRCMPPVLVLTPISAAARQRLAAAEMLLQEHE